MQGAAAIFTFAPVGISLASFLLVAWWVLQNSTTPKCHSKLASSKQRDMFPAVNMIVTSQSGILMCMSTLQEMSSYRMSKMQKKMDSVCEINDMHQFNKQDEWTANTKEKARRWEKGQEMQSAMVGYSLCDKILSLVRCSCLYYEGGGFAKIQIIKEVDLRKSKFGKIDFQDSVPGW
jgi:hypothetical protein